MCYNILMFMLLNYMYKLHKMYVGKPFPKMINLKLKRHCNVSQKRVIYIEISKNLNK